MDEPAPKVLADAPLVIGFTSGSTGHPKANLKTLAGFATSTGDCSAIQTSSRPAPASGSRR